MVWAVLGPMMYVYCTGGQLDWYGRAKKGQFIGRLIIYNTVTGTSNSFSCVQNCLCTPTYYIGTTDPNLIVGTRGNEFPLDALEVDRDCNQNQFTYEINNAEFISSNTDVVTVNGQTATLVGDGTAQITASWSAYDVDQTCTLSAEGECIDARCQATAIGNPIAQTPVTSITLNWTTPHHFSPDDGAVPLASGTPPQGSPAFVTTTTISATASPSGGTFSWSTTSNKVTLSNTTSSTVTVTAEAESDATRDVTITLSYTYNNQTSTKEVPFTVQKPTFMDFISVDGAGTETCPSGQSGIYKDITWQLADKNHNPIPYALPIYDTINNNTPNSCSAPSQGEGTPPGSTTGSFGRWSHHYALCSNACNTGGSCSLAGTQKYFANGFEIDLSFTMSCASITVAGH